MAWNGLTELRKTEQDYWRKTHVDEISNWVSMKTVSKKFQLCSPVYTKIS